MSLRTKNRLRLHRLFDEPLAMHQFGTFVGKEGEDDAGGGDDGKTGDDDAGKTGDDGAGKTGDDDAGKGKPSDAEAKLLKDLMKQKKSNEDLKKQLDDAVGKLKGFEG